MKANFQLPRFYWLGFFVAVLLLVVEGIAALYLLQNITVAWMIVLTVAAAITVCVMRLKRRMFNLKSLQIFGHMPEANRRTGHLIDLHLEGDWRWFRWDGGAWYDTTDNAAVARYRQDAINILLRTAPRRVDMHERLRRVLAGGDIE